MILHEIKLAFMKRHVPYRITTIGVSVTTSCYVELGHAMDVVAVPEFTRRRSLDSSTYVPLYLTPPIRKSKGKHLSTLPILDRMDAPRGLVSQIKTHSVPDADLPLLTKSRNGRKACVTFQTAKLDG